MKERSFNMFQRIKRKISSYFKRTQSICSKSLPHKTSQQKKFVLVVPVWGQSHAENFLEYSLPSFLGQENIPYLAKMADVKILFCVDDTARLIIEEKSKYLSNFCNVVFFDISSVLDKYFRNSSYYGYMLTSIYHHAINYFYEDAKNINFIFCNGDFIFSRNLLKTLYKMEEKGSEIIYCPSFRVSRLSFIKEITPFIKKNILDISSRDLVKISFSTKHPTILAQTINSQELIEEETTLGSSISNQLYWEIGSTLMIGYSFLLFPLMIRPKKLCLQPTGYIDYNMTYDLHPNGTVDYVTDSDSGFIAELEKEEKEIEHFLMMRKNPQTYTNLFKQWANKLHLSHAKNLLIFHTNDLSASNIKFKNTKEKAAKFVKQILKNIKKPKPFENHPFWSSKHQFTWIHLIFYIKKIIISLMSFITKSDLKKTIFLFSEPFLRRNFLNLKTEVSILEKTTKTKNRVYLDAYFLVELFFSDRAHLLKNKEVFLVNFNKDLISHQETELHVLLPLLSKKVLLNKINTPTYKRLIESLILLESMDSSSIFNKVKKTFQALMVFLWPRKKYFKSIEVLKVELLNNKKITLSLPQPKDNFLPIIFTTTVWGDYHRTVFFDYSLKSQLTPKNIPSLKHLESSEYRIYTFPSDENTITYHPIISYLKQFIPVSIITIDPSSIGIVDSVKDRYKMKQFSYKNDFYKGRLSGKSNGFFNADILFSESFLSTSQKILKEYNSIEVVAPRVDFHTFSKYIDSSNLNKSIIRTQNFVSIEAKELSFLTAKYLHVFCNAHIINNIPNTFSHPSHLYWRVQKHAFLAFCFHLYPIFLRSTDLKMTDPLKSTIDDDLITSFDIDFLKRYFIKDGKEMSCCELSPSDMNMKNYQPDYVGINNMIDFYKSHTHIKKRIDHFRVAHRIGDMNIPENKWQSACKEAEKSLGSLFMGYLYNNSLRRK